MLLPQPADDPLQAPSRATARAAHMRASMLKLFAGSSAARKHASAALAVCERSTCGMHSAIPVISL